MAAIEEQRAAQLGERIGMRAPPTSQPALPAPAAPIPEGPIRFTPPAEVPLTIDAFPEPPPRTFSLPPSLAPPLPLEETTPVAPMPLAEPIPQDQPIPPYEPQPQYEPLPQYWVPPGTDRGTPMPAPTVSMERATPSLTHSTFFAEYGSWWLHRESDEGLTWLSGPGLGPFGEDQAGLLRVGWYSNPMERWEFAFLGSLHWNRTLENTTPEPILFPPSQLPSWSADDFFDPLEQTQSHRAEMRSYELNHRWITDDISNLFFGMHVLDYSESFGLRSASSTGSSHLQLDTSNLLVGAQGGLELWRPLSQRFSVGAQGAAGVYANFADGIWTATGSLGDQAIASNDRVQVAGSFLIDAKARYQFTSRWSCYAAYRWWYLAGLADSDDQDLGGLDPTTSYRVSTDDGFLLQGVTVGIDWSF